MRRPKSCAVLRRLLLPGRARKLPPCPVLEPLCFADRNALVRALTLMRRPKSCAVLRRLLLPGRARQLPPCPILEPLCFADRNALVRALTLMRRPKSCAAPCLLRRAAVRSVTPSYIAWAMPYAGESKGRVIHQREVRLSN